jgi:hypothetical protein
MVAAVPATCALVTYLVIEQYKTVMIKRVAEVDLDELLGD